MKLAAPPALKKRPSPKTRTAYKSRPAKPEPNKKLAPNLPGVPLEDEAPLAARDAAYPWAVTVTPNSQHVLWSLPNGKPCARRDAYYDDKKCLTKLVDQFFHPNGLGYLKIERAYYANGQKAYEKPIGNFGLSGTVSSWAENGELMSSVNYRCNRLHGLAQHYDQNKQVIASALYKEGECNGSVWRVQSRDHQAERQHRLSLEQYHKGEAVKDTLMFSDWQSVCAAPTHIRGAYIAPPLKLLPV